MVSLSIHSAPRVCEMLFWQLSLRPCVFGDIHNANPTLKNTKPHVTRLLLELNIYF
jgi:hypothetical protein